MGAVLAFLLLANGAAFGETSTKTLSIAKGFSETLSIPGIIRAAVADPKVVKVKALPPSSLLLTGKRVGKTAVRVWEKSGAQSLFRIRVVEQSAYGDLVGSAVDHVVQVSLEFLELNEAVSREVGIRWPEVLQISPRGILHGGSYASGLNYSVSFDSARGFVHSLVQEGWAKVLARPQLYVRLGEKAVFHSGGEIPVTTSQASHGYSQRRVEWKPYGLTVQVKPQSVDGFNIRSDIHVEISELNPSHTVNGVPALTKRKLETKIKSQDGEVVVLSGLVRQAASVQWESVPGLAKIPLLGPLLFKKKKAGQESSEILLAVSFSMAYRSEDRARMKRLRNRFDEGEFP